MSGQHDATHDFVEALSATGRKVEHKTKDTWLAQCPAHPDGRPSLSIRRGRGQVLMFCFAGCQTADIANEVGLKLSDLFDDERGIDYEYRYNGNVVRTVHRTPDKRFSQNIITDAIVPLYGASPDEIGACIAEGIPIFVVEGEKDADTILSVAGCAVSAPMGATNWNKADYSPLAGGNIRIVADKDEPGLERARALYRHLVKLGCTVGVIQARVGKDATDHVVAGFGLDGFEGVVADPDFEQEVEQRLRNRQIEREAKLRDDRRLEALNPLAFNPMTLGQILDMPDQAPDWLMPGLLERADRLILTGFEGQGKSWLLRQLCIAMAAGVHMFDRAVVPQKRVLVVDAENTPSQWARGTRYMAGRMTEMGGDPRNNMIVQAGQRLDLTQDRYVKQVQEWVDEYHPDALYIGPLYKLAPKEITTDDDAAPLIAVLDRWREQGIALLMEAHAGKGVNGGERDLRPRGSSALLGWPEMGLGLQPIEDDETMATLIRWRGDREEREWPQRIRRGGPGDLPWMKA